MRPVCSKPGLFHLPKQGMHIEAVCDNGAVLIVSAEHLNKLPGSVFRLSAALRLPGSIKDPLHSSGDIPKPQRQILFGIKARSERNFADQVSCNEFPVPEDLQGSF